MEGKLVIARSHEKRSRQDVTRFKTGHVSNCIKTEVEAGMSIREDSAINV
jgi:hypothetical protein